MKVSLSFFLCLLLLSPLGPQTASAQEAAEAVEAEAAAAETAPAPTPEPNLALREYREKALHHNMGFLGYYELHRNGKSTDLGVFGGNYETIFAGSPGALASMRNHRKLKLGGSVIYFVGAFVMVYSTFSGLPGSTLGPIFGAEKTQSNGIVVGGIVAVIGALVMGASWNYLDDAVDQYNLDLYNRLQR